MKNATRCLMLTAVLVGLILASPVFAQDPPKPLVIAPVCAGAFQAVPTASAPFVKQDSLFLCSSGCSGQPPETQCVCPPTSPNPTGYAECFTWRADCYFL